MEHARHEPLRQSARPWQSWPPTRAWRCQRRKTRRYRRRSCPSLLCLQSNVSMIGGSRPGSCVACVTKRGIARSSRPDTFRLQFFPGIRGSRTTVAKIIHLRCRRGRIVSPQMHSPHTRVLRTQSPFHQHDVEVHAFIDSTRAVKQNPVNTRFRSRNPRWQCLRIRKPFRHRLRKRRGRRGPRQPQLTVARRGRVTSGN